MNTTNLTLSNNDKLALISNLSTMLTAGIPILEIVDSLLEDSKKNQKKLLETLRTDLLQGKQIHATLTKFPGMFDKVTVNIIKASEEAGTLDVTLKDLKESIKKDIEFNDRIRSALVYPGFIMLVFMGVLAVILTVVIPKISTLFVQLHVPLPWSTKLLIIMSQALVTYPILVIIGLAGVGIGVGYLFKTQKRTVVSVLLSLPVVSQLGRQIDITRFARSMYLLLTAGIPITSALLLTQEIMMKKEMAHAIGHVHDEVIAGKKLSKGLKDAKNLIPGIAIKIIEAGERSGTLDKSMQDISEYFDYQVSNTLKFLTSLLEPLMLVIVGVLTGGIMFSIITPIYGIITQINP